MNKNSFSIDEAEKAIALGVFYYLSRISGEMDMIGLLPDDKLIFNFEIKFQIADNKKSPTKLLESATQQTKNNEEYFARVFGPLLTKGWRLIKVPVIIQSDGKNTLDPSTYCDHCKNFIIDAECLANLPPWFEKTIQTTSAIKNFGMSIDYSGYLKVTEMIISAVSTESHLSAWKIVEGQNYCLPIAAGYTKIDGTFGLNPKKLEELSKKLQQTSKSHASSDEISFDEALHKFHDAQKLIFFSKLQLSLIDVSYHIHMILWSDYGTGMLILLLIMFKKN